MSGTYSPNGTSCIFRYDAASSAVGADQHGGVEIAIRCLGRRAHELIGADEERRPRLDGKAPDRRGEVRLEVEVERRRRLGPHDELGTVGDHLSAQIEVAPKDDVAKLRIVLVLLVDRPLHESDAQRRALVEQRAATHAHKAARHDGGEQHARPRSRRRAARDHASAPRRRRLTDTSATSADRP